MLVMATPRALARRYTLSCRGDVRVCYLFRSLRREGLKHFDLNRANVRPTVDQSRPSITCKRFGSNFRTRGINFSASEVPAS